jgi:hypothetical protein
MNKIRNRGEIEIRIKEIEKKLEIIDQAIEKEMKRSFFARRPNLCQLLDIEKRIYSSLYVELKWILHE